MDNKFKGMFMLGGFIIFAIVTGFVFSGGVTERSTEEIILGDFVDESNSVSR